MSYGEKKEQGMSKPESAAAGEAVTENVCCRYCGTKLIRNYMCFLWMHDRNPNCPFSGKESKSHWGDDIESKYGTNDFLPDALIPQLARFERRAGEGK